MPAKTPHIIFLSVWAGLLLLMACEPSQRRQSPALTTFPPFLAEDPLDVDAQLASMSVDEQIGQLLMLRVCGEPPSVLYKWTRTGRIGGLLMYDVRLSRFLTINDSLQKLAQYPLWISTQEPLTLNNQFNDVVGFPSEATLQDSPAADTLREWLSQIFPAQAEAAGVHISLNLSVPEDSLSEENCAHTICDELDRVVGFNTKHILSVGRSLRPSLFLTSPDSAQILDSLLRPYRQLIRQGIGGFWMDVNTALLPRQPAGFAVKTLRDQLQFGGLLIGEASSPQLAERMLYAGADMLVVDENPERIFMFLRKLVRNGAISRATLEEKVRRILLAKAWTFRQENIDEEARAAGLPAKKEPKAPVNRRKVMEHFKSEDWFVLQHQLYESGTTLVHRRRLIPIMNTYNKRFRILQYGGAPAKVFSRHISLYAPVDTAYTLSPNRWREQFSAEMDSARQYAYIVVTDQPVLSSRADTAFLEAVHRLSRRAPLVFAHFGQTDDLVLLDTAYAIVHSIERNSSTEALMAQLIFGATAAQGRLPASLLSKFDLTRYGLPSVSRLSYGRSSLAGIKPSRLAGIDAIVQSAIQKKAMPGCQVLVAKDGRVVYRKAFGHHTYDSTQTVSPTDLYDIASITKVASTTLATMNLYENNAFRLNDKLKKHLNLNRRSSLRELLIGKLLTHQSGLQANMPVVPYLRFRAPLKDNCDEKVPFCKRDEKPFTLQVADSFYFNKNLVNDIWTDVNKLRVDRRGIYRYSDVNFYLLQRLVEEKTDRTLETWVQRRFYQPLGLQTIGYHPLYRFSLNRIVPTENDARWRKQLVRGYVHDETAALLGGAAGNAGLFSNADDLAVIFQMLLNKGQYAGRQYFKASTIRLFTNEDRGIYRGLGFDKPNEKRMTGRAHARTAPLSLFGHTGFTGACVWADPDNDLIFVFLSNRIHPDARNRMIFKLQVRERAHQVVYDALKTYKFKLPAI